MRYVLLCLTLVALAMQGVCQPRQTSSWKGFSAPMLNGGSFTLDGKGSSPVLLAFLALGKDADPAQSRAAAVVLASLDHQYHDRGLQVMAVDAAAIETHASSQTNDVRNRAADWNLTYPVLEDPEGRSARAFHVHTLPTTVLVAASGREIERWEGYPHTPVLAQAVERVLGGPLAALPRAAMQPDRAPITSFTPGAIWPDTQGVPINAHGAGFLYHAGTYYWYGEFKTAGTAGNLANVGISCYSSRDLYNWKNEGIVLPVSADPASEIAKGSIIERPKVLFNVRSHQFVMWFHLELKGQGYKSARVGVAVSSSPTGPFRYLRSFRPDGEMSRDMTLFEDRDGKAYLFTASENNKTMHVSELSADYLSTSGHWKRIFIGESIEAPTVFHYRGRYYFVGSHCTGWAPNPAYAAVADSVWGPWKPIGNPAVGPHADTTFLAQGTFMLPVHGMPGAFIFIADRWNPQNAMDGRYLWLPVEITPTGLVIRWRDHWQLQDLAAVLKTKPGPGVKDSL